VTVTAKDSDLVIQCGNCGRTLSARWQVQWYLIFLGTVRSHLLEDVLRRVGNNLWPEHDRAPARHESAVPQDEPTCTVVITWRPRLYLLTISVIW